VEDGPVAVGILYGVTSCGVTPYGVIPYAVTPHGATRTAALAVLLLLVFASSAAAQAVVADDVSEEATEGNSQPKMGRDASGGIHLTYVKPAGGVDQVFIASSRDGGRTWRSIQLTRRTTPSRYPALAVEPDGTLHAVWTTYEPIGHVYYARTSNGRWGTPVKISPGNAYAGVPAVAVDPERNVHIVWYGIRDQAPQVLTRHGSIYEILYSGRTGGRWSNPVIISPGVPDSINPALAADGAGTLHSAWYQFDIRAYQVQYARRRARWELPHQITTGTTDAFAVTLAVGPQDRVYIAWERRAREGIRIFFTEGPDRWIAPVAVSETDVASNPSVAADARRRVFVAWESEGRLFLRRREGRWLGVERVTQEGQNRYPILAASGDAVDLAWTQETSAGYRLRFAAIGAVPGGGGAGRSAGGLIVVILVAVLLFWQLRRRRRLAP